MRQQSFSEEDIRFWQKERCDKKVLLSPAEHNVEDANKSFNNFLDDPSDDLKPTPLGGTKKEIFNGKYEVLILSDILILSGDRKP